jgi:hypothetical protein
MPLAPRGRLRRRFRILLLSVVGLTVALVAAPAVDLPASAQSGYWISMFSGAPASPVPYNPSTWDVQVHSRDRDTWTSLEPMNAHHGANCAGYPSVHAISSYADAVYQCNEHVMTAINAEGYGLIMLTPNQMVDFSAGEATINFDMSTFRSSSRDWVSIWLSPFEDQIPLPLSDWLPDLTGGPRNALHLQMGVFNGNTTFQGVTSRNFAGTDITTNPYLTYESFLTTSAVRRDTFQLRISRTSVKFGMPAYNKWWVDRTIPDLGWSRAVVQFGHHSYNPNKACDFNGTCSPNTWHWDNVNISNAVPFTLLKADLPYLDASTRRHVTFSAGAPAGSYLRFAGIGTNLQVSFNGGQSWQNAQMHAVEKVTEETFKPYWVAVPVGTSRVDFRGSPWWGGDWMARGISIWSQNLLTPPGTTPTRVPTSTPTPIPLPPPTSSCTTRPQTTVQAQAIGSGRLQVTVRVGRPAGASSNIVRRIQVAPVQNAQVSILGQTFGAAGGSVAPTTPGQSITFVVTRQPASAQVPVTVPLVITDDCGAWNTFVGGGPTAF